MGNGGGIEYIPFPSELRGQYQNFTQADTTALLAAGYDKGFRDIQQGVKAYCALLDKNGGFYE